VEHVRQGGGGRLRNSHTILFGNPKDKRSLEEEDNIKMYLKIKFECVDCIHLAQDRIWWLAVLDTVTHFLGL
jgi:hypothetical protein